MDKGLINGVLFLELKNAFDTVDHRILILKLQLYGADCLTLIWFSSYLTKTKNVCKWSFVRLLPYNLRCSGGIDSRTSIVSNLY